VLKVLGEQKSKIRNFFFVRSARETVRLKPTENKDLPYNVLRPILQFFVYSVVMGHCGFRGPAGKSVPRAPRWQKTALLA